VVTSPVQSDWKFLAVLGTTSAYLLTSSPTDQWQNHMRGGGADNTALTLTMRGSPG
jgi:hypothetical protein